MFRAYGAQGIGKGELNRSENALCHKIKFYDKTLFSWKWIKYFKEYNTILNNYFLEICILFNAT